MSVRFEWIAADHPFLGVHYVEPGHFVDDDEPDVIGAPGLAEGKTERGAVVISYDEAVVLDGTPAQLWALVDRISAALPPRTTEEA